MNKRDRKWQQQQDKRKVAQRDNPIAKPKPPTKDDMIVNPTRLHPACPIVEPCPVIAFKYPVTQLVYFDGGTGRALFGSSMIDRCTGERVAWHQCPDDFTAEHKGWIKWSGDDAVANYKKRLDAKGEYKSPFSFFD